MSKSDNVKRAQRMVRAQAAERAQRRRRRLVTTIGAVVLLVVAGLIGWAIYANQKPTTVAVPASVSDVGGNDSGLVAAGDGPVPVEVYFDFLCPFCKQFEQTVTPTLDQLVAQKKITLVWHPLGFLDSHTNPRGYSTHSAASAGCAADAGKLKQYGEALFAAQPAEGGPGLSDDQIVDIAGTAGIITPHFASCLRDGTYTNWVSQATDEAVKRGVVQTPTVYVDGKLVANPTPEAITAAVAAAG